MTWWSVLALVACGLACYLSALATALLTVSPSGLERRLTAAGRPELVEWLAAHATEAHLATSLLRTALRVAVVLLLVVEGIGVGSEVEVSVQRLLIVAAVAVGLLWLSTGLIASSLARHATETLVAGALPMLRVIHALCLPLTRGLGFLDEAIRRLTGANLREREEEAEAELLRSIGDTHREGMLDERSATLLENVVEFSQTDVAEVMTPRTDIDGIELTDDLTAIRSFITKVGHSRIPVYVENLDQLVGVLYVKDLVPYLGEDASDFRLEPLLRQPIMVPETKQVRELLSDFQRSEVHLAVVIDEYGGTAGLVTIEDVLEEIVGEIHDEHDLDEDETPTLTRIDDVRVEVDGRFHIDDLNEQLGLELPEDDDFDTVAGYVLSVLGHVPEVGEKFEAYGAVFTALDATPTHVKRIGIAMTHLAETGD